MNNFGLRVVLNALLVTSGLTGCRESEYVNDPPDPARSTGGVGGSAAGGRGGRSGGTAGTGGTATTTGAGGSGAAGSGAAGSGAAGSGVAGSGGASDAASGVTDVASGPDGSASDVGGGGGQTGSDAGGGLYGPDGGIAICHPDPTVIAICRQLENACENCPPGGAPPGNKLAAVCFDLIKKAKAGMATDAECAKFAVDNKCTVDRNGNVCGSLNCYAPGCSDRARCLNRQQWGDGSMCQPFKATCGPCK